MIAAGKTTRFAASSKKNRFRITLIEFIDKRSGSIFFLLLLPPLQLIEKFYTLQFLRIRSYSISYCDDDITQMGSS